MGIVFSRFKFFSSTTSRTQRATYAESQFNEGKKNGQTTMNNSSTNRLNEINSFQDFDNVLSVNCSPQGSMCMFGQEDHVNHN